MCSGTKNFCVSQGLQTSVCLLGQSMVYEKGSELLKELTRVDLSAMQIQRICNHYGSVLESLIKSNCTAIIPKLIEKDKKDPTYIMMDGSMLFTREQEWKELKLARIFKGCQIVDIQEHRREIMQSIYVSHLGSVSDFFPKLERHLPGYQNKVIIGDGAKWIWNWSEDNYPGATQILDFYHAKEKLVLFAKYQFKNEQKRKKWTKAQCQKLRNNEVEQVMKSTQNLKARSKESKQAKKKLLSYYEEHEDRMQYKTYREKGLLIGSGPIEAAHRSVIQQRMKLSGQKWSIKGANAIANLRCYQASGAWDLVKKVICAA
jgi:hypothetical protein